MSSGSFSSTKSNILNIVTTRCRTWQRGCGNSVDAVCCAIGITVTPCAVPLVWLWRRHRCSSFTTQVTLITLITLITPDIAALSCVNLPRWLFVILQYWHQHTFDALGKCEAMKGLGLQLLAEEQAIWNIVCSYHRIINDSLGRSKSRLGWQGSRLQA